MIDIEKLEKERVTNINTGKLDKKDDGTNAKTRKNLLLLFRGVDDKLDDLFRYNEATKNIEVTREQRLNQYITLKKGLLSDNITNQLWAYISEEYGLEYKESDICNVIEITASSNSYNPIKDMLEESKATCKDVDPFEIIRKYINVEDNKYNRIVFDLFFRGAIARIYQPGCQFDYCLDFTGKQGTGKSTFLREMFKGFYTEVESFSDKDDLLKMASAWLVNDDELCASNSRKSNFDTIKRVITTREIKIRKPYGRMTETIPVDYVFSRTTNNKGHLKDATGDRRFLVVDVLPREKGQPNKITNEDFYDIWGNYFKAYDANKKLYYDEDSEEGKLISEVRENHKRHDEVVELLEWYLEVKIPENFYSPNVGIHRRQRYYKDVENFGESPQCEEDVTDGIQWLELVERDRLNVSDVMKEVFDGYQGESPKTIRNKIKMYLENSDQWKYTSSLYFRSLGNNHRKTSGFIKVG